MSAAKRQADVARAKKACCVKGYETVKRRARLAAFPGVTVLGASVANPLHAKLLHYAGSIEREIVNYMVVSAENEECVVQWLENWKHRPRLRRHGSIFVSAIRGEEL